MKKSQTALKPKEEKQAEPEQVKEQDAEVLDAIGQQIMDKLGTPDRFYRIDVNPLWDTKFRVNVYCEEGESRTIFKSFRITDSFFVVTSPEGGILRSIPEIETKYGNVEIEEKA